MQKSDLPKEQYDKLLTAIFDILRQNGPKATTMDLVAQKLQMSKRTLYEIFANKDDMLREAMAHFHAKGERKVLDIMSHSTDMMRALIEVLSFQRDMMSGIEARFFSDMDSHYPELRDHFDKSRSMGEHVMEVFKIGISQGVFRKDVNYPVTALMFRVQMEALKRMEEFFPEGVTLLEALDTICLGLLRSIATPKGMMILDELDGRFETASSLDAAKCEFRDGSPLGSPV